MAEMVRFRPLEHGKIELHILDYNDEKRRWVGWHGYARVRKDNLVPADRLKPSVVHQHDLRTLSTPDGPGPSDRLTGGQRGSTKASTHRPVLPGPWKIRVPLGGMYQCPICLTQSGQRRVAQHLIDAHGISPSARRLRRPCR